MSIQLGQTSLRLANAYNLSWNPSAALRPGKIFTYSPTPTLVLGDFNIHHPSANPRRPFVSRELRASEPYFERAANTGYSLINTPGVATFLPSFQGHSPSVLDLAFANQALLSLHPQWENNLPPTGTDHTAPSTTIRRIDSESSLPSPDWNAIDWDVADPDIKVISLPPPPKCPAEVEALFAIAHKMVMTTLKAHTTQRKPSRWTKRRWNAELADLCRIKHERSHHAS